MKIGIVTFHASHNYGAMLQAYALKRKVESLGIECNIINYKTLKMENDYLIINLNFKKGIKPQLLQLMNILVYNKLKRRWNKFESFARDNFNLTERYSSAEEMKKTKFDFDALICGSDQVWNPNGRADCIYMLGFCNNRNVSRIAYAPSFGKGNIPNNRISEYKKNISKIDYLSVREESGNKIIKDLTGRDAKVVADPVFFFSKTEWDQLFSDRSIEEEPYIMCYFTHIPLEIEKTINYIKNETGYKVIMLHDKYYSKISVDKIIRDAGPIDFIRLFSRASYIITTSFHGTAFSIINRKPFLSIKHSNSDSRIIDLLKVTKLYQRFVDVESSIEKSLLEIDYTESEGFIDNFIHESKKFLENALQEAMLKTK
jgi:hypothetical protein